MVKTDCQNFKACQKQKGVNFFCDGCPGPESTRILKPWEIKELERKQRIEKKKQEPATKPLKSETKPPIKETNPVEKETPKPKTEGLGLLAKAKLRPVSNKQPVFDPEEFEVAKLWCKGELTNGQVNFAYESKGGSAINRMAICLREMCRQGKLKFV